MALGCSTNTVLHLPAIAHSAGIKVNLNDFNKVSKATPHLVKLSPAGPDTLFDLWQAGGLPALMKELDEYGLIKTNCITVTGKTVAENIKGLR